MSTKNQRPAKIKKSLIALAVLIGLSLSIQTQIGGDSVVLADETETQLRQATQDLEDKIAANEKILAGLESEAATLRNRIAGFQAEIQIANDKITLIGKKIDQLKIDIQKAEAELERQKNLLKESLVALYKQGNVSTIELLAASDSYTEFINEQEYLERLRAGIAESAAKVKDLKEELEAQKVAQEELLEDQEKQREILAEKKAEQDQILAQTEGQEAKYRGIVADLEEQRRQAEEELKQYLASLIDENYTSLGYVLEGTAIGLVGSTGFSTGPHLHFAITDGVNFYNPVQSSGTLSNGMSWPLPNSNWGNITQGYGCVAPYSWYVTKCNGNQNSFHSGLDISGWYGDPVTAAADGDIIFRGWLGGYGNTVIIAHSNGLFTYYPHLLE